LQVGLGCWAVECAVQPGPGAAAKLNRLAEVESEVAVYSDSTFLQSWAEMEEVEDIRAAEYLKEQS